MVLSNLLLEGKDKGFHTFPKGISLKVNVTVRLDIELASYNVAVQYVSYYATGTFLEELEMKGRIETIQTKQCWDRL